MRTSLVRKLFIAPTFMILALTILPAWVLAPRQASAQDFLLEGPTVVANTTAGPVMGRNTPSVIVFRGIPYAAAPRGRLRFRPPVPPTRWATPRSARLRTPACPQLLEDVDAAEDGDAVMSEDCLTVNVWTPALNGKPRPVMVWIHGGSLIEGSAADSCYEGTVLAERGDVVVITLQYRLGVLGFLYLGDIGGANYAASGNLGILDQIAALKWVQQNAAAFGGDPGNVTVFGESSGGDSIYALLATPLATGLFHKAIVQSGGPYGFWARADAIRIRNNFQHYAHAESITALQRLSMEEVLRAQAKLFQDAHGYTAFIDDGVVFSGAAAGASPERNVPLLIGTNADEARYWIAMMAAPIDREPEDSLQKRLETYFGPPGRRLVEVYKKYFQSDENAVATLLGDAVLRIPSLRWADANSTQQPTYVYLFTYRSPARGPSGLEYGAMHGIEVAPVFHIDTPLAYTYTGPKGSWTRLSDQMVAAWTHFARTGDPNNEFLPKWPPYDAITRPTMAFGTHSDVMLDPYGLERRAWDDVPTIRFRNPEVDTLLP